MQESCDAGAIEAGRITMGGNLEVGGFWRAVLECFLLTILTELGDKTFFMSVVMAMKFSRFFVLVGSLAAMIFMTLLSTVAGKLLPRILSPRLASIVGCVLFLVFGLQMIYEWWQARKADKENDGLADAEKEVKEQHSQLGNKSLSNFMIVTRCFLLTFLAEWGDRSQLTTVVMAASRNEYGIAVGGILGQTVCTTLAVMGGKLLASRISERLVSLLGGCFFLLSGCIIGVSLLL